MLPWYNTAPASERVQGCPLHERSEGHNGGGLLLVPWACKVRRLGGGVGVERVAWCGTWVEWGIISLVWCRGKVVRVSPDRSVSVMAEGVRFPHSPESPRNLSGVSLAYRDGRTTRGRQRLRKAGNRAGFWVRAGGTRILEDGCRCCFCRRGPTERSARSGGRRGTAPAHQCEPAVGAKRRGPAAVGGAPTAAAGNRELPRVLQRAA